jgi:hypothetical protein
MKLHQGRKFGLFLIREEARGVVQTLGIGSSDGVIGNKYWTRRAKAVSLSAPGLFSLARFHESPEISKQ